MRRYDLSRVEALQCSVDVANLKKGRSDKDEYKKVGDGKGQGMPERVGEKRGDAFGGQSSVATCFEY